MLESVRPPSTTVRSEQLKQTELNDDAARFDLMYRRGLNGVVVADAHSDQHRQKVSQREVILMFLCDIN